jgi:hypothetical protein
MNDFWTSIVTVATAIVGLAIIAVLVSNNAQTSNVIQSAAGGFAADLSAAVSPITGATGSGFGGSAFNFGGFSSGQPSFTPHY